MVGKAISERLVLVFFIDLFFLCTIQLGYFTLMDLDNLPVLASLFDSRYFSVILTNTTSLMTELCGELPILLQ